MKIYEKPMATIEKLEVNDVITTSGIETISSFNAEGAAALKNAAVANEAIVFEW